MWSVWENELKVFGKLGGDAFHLVVVNCTIGGEAMKAKNTRFAHIDKLLREFRELEDDLISHDCK